MSFLNIDLLKNGVEAIGLNLTTTQFEQLDRFSALLFKWNKTYNLTSIRSKEDVLSHHILDSLAVVPYFDHYLKEGSRLLDVGSGGGLPAIPYAICRPDICVELVETVGKKTAFLTQACVELGLKNVQIHNLRVENLRVTPFNAISSRAFSSLALFTSLSNHLLNDNGVWLALKGRLPEDEISELDRSVIVTEMNEISVPLLNEKRHLIILMKNLL